MHIGQGRKEGKWRGEWILFATSIGIQSDTDDFNVIDATVVFGWDASGLFFRSRELDWESA
jgi:hypothetical protein